jgi:hypothetical protein
MNNSPFVYDIVRRRQHELEAAARQARLRRELAGPSFLRRLATTWRRPTTGHRRPVQPAAARG